MIRVFEAASSILRREAARAFVGEHSPATEILVVGPTRRSVDDLCRVVELGNGATFGLHRFGFTQLAARLAAHGLARAGLAPSTRLGTDAVAARATFESRGSGALGRFEGVSRFPGFPRALAGSLRELRLAEVDVDALLGAEADDVAALLRRFEEELDEAAVADSSRLLELAATGLAEAPFEDLTAAPLLLLDLPLRSRRERDLLKALHEATAGTFATVPMGDRATLEVLGSCGDCEVERPADGGATDRGAGSQKSLSRLRQHLFHESVPAAGGLDDEVRFFSAPGEGRECIEIARLVLDEARRGVPFDEMAVFLRAPELYSGLLETAFRRAGIPLYFARGTRRPDPAGRAFLALLACCSEKLSAKRFAEYLSFGQIPELEDGAPPAAREVWQGPADDALGVAVQKSLPFGDEFDESLELPESSGPSADDDRLPTLEGTLRAPWKWEELLVEAAVIGGRDRWRRRLRGLTRELEIQRDRVAREEPESARRTALERELGNLAHLESYALPLIDGMDEWPKTASWGEWLSRLSVLAPRVLRKPERVLAVLAELEPMASIGPVSIDEVREVLSDSLANLERDPPAERYGHVFAATPEQARGRSFRVVFVPGLAERIFPQRPREDPLLLDRVRVRLTEALALQEDRSHEERLMLRLTLGAAEERAVLSYSRVDVAEGRPRVPSFYGLDVARAVRGALPDYEELERDAAAQGQARLAWPAPPDPDRAIDAVEHDLSILWPLLHESESKDARGRARYLLELNDHLARSLRSRWVRWVQRRWAPEDGLVRVTETTEEALASQRPGARPFSVSALQRFAVCPYQFLLSAVHGLEPRREIAPLERLDPLTRGSMFHRVQSEFLCALRDGGRLPVRPENLNAATGTLDETLYRVATEYRDELAPAIVRVWEDEVDAMRSDLRAWLRRWAEDREWQPAYFELGFGLKDLRGRDEASRVEPVVLEGGWQLRGAIDLVETRVGAASLRVTDHKTGKNATRENLIVGQGEVLQPVLYGLAAEVVLGASVEEGRLYFCTARGDYTERVVPLLPHARRHGLEVLEIIDRAIARGALPPAPRKGACAYCDFRTVCGPHEERRVTRKDPDLLRDLRALRSLP